MWHNQTVEHWFNICIIHNNNIRHPIAKHALWQCLKNWSFFWPFPMTMKANSMPFYHLSSCTIKVYKGYCKEHGTKISYNGRKGCTLLWFVSNVASKDIELQHPNLSIISNCCGIWIPNMMVCHLRLVNWGPKGHSLNIIEN